MTNYQDIYPQKPQINSLAVSDLLRLEFFESNPGEMPYKKFNQHHILINLSDDIRIVENKRDGVVRKFNFSKYEVIVTPAGVKSGWKWFDKSKVIVITLDPKRLESFALTELAIILTQEQLKNIPQFIDQDITHAAEMLMQALDNKISSQIMFESLARVFLIKLIEKYGLQKSANLDFSKQFTAIHYKRTLDYISKNYKNNISLETLATQVGISQYHFSRLFKTTIGLTPHQFITQYRIEESKKMLKSNYSISEVALECGFADQAHFSKVFKKIEKLSPKEWLKK